MKRIFLVSIILLLASLPLPIDAAVTVTRDYWENGTYLLNNPNIVENINKTTYQSNKIPTIRYEINLGRKESSRIMFNIINVDTYIDTSKNIAIERFEIIYVVNDLKNPNLVGEKIFFSNCWLDPRCIESSRNTKIISVNAPGWEIVKYNESTTMILENKENKIFGNKIIVWVAIKEQNKFKRREFILYNREVIDFETTLTIDNNYEFTRFEPNLPYEFKSEKEIHSYADIWALERNSFVLSQHTIKNKIDFIVRLKGDDYEGQDLFQLKPEKVIEFDYSYDYQEDVNAKIVEENRESTNQTLEQIKEESRNSTNLALILFGFSVLISILSLICSLFPEKSKSIINRINFKKSNCYKSLNKFIKKHNGFKKIKKDTKKGK